MEKAGAAGWIMESLEVQKTGNFRERLSPSLKQEIWDPQYVEGFKHKPCRQEMVKSRVSWMIVHYYTID
jgi:hypothetical protein